MTTQQKVENKGYRVTYNLGNGNSEKSVASVTASKGNRTITAKNITSLLKSL